MSFSYLVDPLDNATECEANNQQVKNSSLCNGKSRNDFSLCAEITGTELGEEFKFHNCEGFSTTESSFNDKKLRFSEKLKVLLKNGGNKNDKLGLADPYKFCEIDSQFGESLKAFNTVNSVERTLQKNEKVWNASSQNSIIHARSVKPKISINELAEEKNCNGDITSNLNKNMKLSKAAVPIYATENCVATTPNPSAFKMHQGNLVDQFKVSSVKNGRTLPSAHLPSNNKPLLNKLLGKSKLQNSKPTNTNSSLKGNRNVLGKPFGFNQLHVQKYGNAKGDKKVVENKQRNFLKGKSLLNQLQKTALLSRPVGQAAKKNSSRGQFFGMVRASEKDVKGATGPNLVNKSASANRKSLLEESLLGIKNYGIDKDLSNGITLHSKSAHPNCSKNEDMKSLVETGSTTVLTTPKLRTESLDQSKHESLQRIWNIRNKLKGLKRDHHHFGLALNEGDFDENVNSECLLFQNYWFSVCNDNDSVSNNNRRRDTKISQLKVELRHKIKQLQWKYKDEYRDRVVQLLVESARKQPNLTAFLIRLENSKFNNRRRISRVKPLNLLKPVLCTFANPESGQKCGEQAMPCVKFCQQHIACSNDQLLFTPCSARQSDNTTCRAAVLNQNWENPLCLRHKRLESISELPKKIMNPKPLNRSSQPRKRSRSSTGCISRSGRSRKRKRPAQKDRKEASNDTATTGFINDSSNFNFVTHHVEQLDPLRRQQTLAKITPQVVSKCDIDESQEVEVGEEVLAMAADLPLELATQATKLLEEHDFTNVLNHIPADAFNDLFTEDKEEYEPTPQETEELERALEAVDKDVKSLEKLSQTQGILDTLLDEQTIAQTLAQLPEVTASLEVPQTLVPVFYQNGFSNINQLEQTLQDVNKSLTQTVLLNQGTEGLSNHFVSNLTISNHTDVLQS